MKPSERMQALYAAGMIRYNERPVDEKYFASLLNVVMSSVAEILDQQAEEIKSLRENNRCRCEQCIADRS